MGSNPTPSTINKKSPLLWRAFLLIAEWGLRVRTLVRPERSAGDGEFAVCAKRKKRTWSAVAREDDAPGAKRPEQPGALAEGKRRRRAVHPTPSTIKQKKARLFSAGFFVFDGGLTGFFTFDGRLRSELDLAPGAAHSAKLSASGVIARHHDR